MSIQPKKGAPFPVCPSFIQFSSQAKGKYLRQNDVRGAFASVTPWFDIESYFLVIGQTS
jgi:hypothetical protein